MLNNLLGKLPYMGTLQNRIAELMQATGLTVGQLADIAGVSSSAASQWKDGPTKALKTGPATRLAERTGYMARWIADGDGPKKITTPYMNWNVEPGPEIRGQVPLISWVQAGSWSGAVDPRHPCDADVWLDCPVTHSGSTFALRVRGDSMTAPHANSRSYPEGCVIFVDAERRDPSNGDRILARLVGTEEVTFKVYKHEDGRQWLQPLNPAHEPIRSEFHVLGKVLGKWEDG